LSRWWTAGTSRGSVPTFTDVRSTSGSRIRHMRRSCPTHGSSAGEWWRPSGTGRWPRRWGTSGVG